MFQGPEDIVNGHSSGPRDGLYRQDLALIQKVPNHPPTPVPNIAEETEIGERLLWGPLPTLTATEEIAEIDEKGTVSLFLVIRQDDDTREIVT